MIRYEWEYRKLGDFTYNILPEFQIKPLLLEYLKREWKIDHTEFPDQHWTVEWLDLLLKLFPGGFLRRFIFQGGSIFLLLKIWIILIYG